MKTGACIGVLYTRRMKGKPRRVYVMKDPGSSTHLLRDLSESVRDEEGKQLRFTVRNEGCWTKDSAIART